MKFLKRGVNSLGGCVTLVRNFGMGQRLGSLLSLILIALIVSAESAAAAIAFVQVNSATPQTPQTSVAVAYTAAQTAGNLNVVVVGWADSTATVNSVTDSNKNSYTLAVGPTMQGGASQSIYYAKNIVAGVNTVTVTFNGAASYPDIRILEYSGLDTVSPVDVVASASGSSATSSTAAVTTTNANDLIVAANDVTTYTTGPGTGFTSRILTSDGDIAQDQIVTAAGSYSATAPLGTSGGWVMQMVAFKAAGSVPPPNPTLTVTKSGSGTGTVTSTPAGINCGSTCSASFTSGTSVTLTATADTGSTATGFSGGCSSTSSTCTFTITANTAVTATFTANDTQAPTAPSGLTAAAVSSSQINLSWTASTDNVGVSGYWIERCQGAGCSNFARVNTSLVTGTSYSDSGLGANTSYTYRVQAADAAGNLSPYSGTASATTAAAAAIAFVQVNSATPQTPQTSVAVAYTAAQTAGNLNVVVVGWADSTATVNSVTDSNKNSYTLAVGPTMQGGASQSIYYAKNIVAGVNTVTVTFNGAASYPDIRILEYSGLDTVSPVDVVASASGSSATSSTAAVTTTNANDLIFAANDVATYTTGPGTGFTSRIITQDGDIAQDRIVTATGSYSAGAPLGMSGGWVMQMVAFKAAGSAPPPNPTLTVTKSGSGTGTVTSAPAGINCGSTCSASFASGTSVTLTATADAGSTATGFNGGCSSASSTCTFTITANAAVTATFNLNDTQAPTAPSNLAATAAATGGQINLTWTASTDNVGVSGYWIERCQGAGCSSFARINPSLVTTTNYGDSGLGANTSYTYRVQAADAAGNLSPYSGTASATTAAGTGTTTAINFVQINSAVPQTPQTSVSVNYQGKQTAGNLNVVVVGWSDSTSTISSVTDTKGNIYSLAVGPTRQSGVQSQSIYYAKNIVAADINTNTVTVQFSNAVSYPDVRILEYSGLDTTNPVDVVAEATNTSATSSTAAVTTTHAYDLIFAANYVVTSTSGAGAGFTNRIITYPDGNIAEDQIVTSTGSYSATAPLNSSGGWVMQMVAFKGAANSPPPPSQVGQWSAVMNWPLVSIHGAVMPTGKVLVWDSDTSSSKTSNSGGNGVQVWDPIANTFSTVPFDAGDLFCAGLAELPDGRVFVVGGHNINNYNGLTGVAIFDPSTNSWGTGASMAFPRWYPTVTALPDGRMLATSGAMNCQDCNADTPEVYDPAKNTWTQLTNATIHLPLYPHMFTLPDGRVLVTGSYESYIEPVVIQVLDLNTQTWTTVDPTPVNGGSAAMYLPGKIITSGLGTLGGADVTTTPSTTTTYVLDMTQPTPAWRQTSPMAYPRDYHNMTILPDGNVLVTGGGQTTGATDPTTAVFAAELWSPATETWTTLSSMQTPRRYHSIALLLPDGRVLVAGGGRNNGAYTATNANDHLNAEIFSPPYLFKGARPTITTAPTTLPYGTNAFVATPDGASISSVSLIRLGAVTHAFNMNQRFLNLTFSQASGGLNVQAPANANLAPPGYYMLFLVNGNGVPSVASILKVQ